MGILDDLPAIIASAADIVASDMTLTKAATATRESDGRGGFMAASGAPPSHAFRGVMSGYSDYLRALAGGAIADGDRKVIILAGSLVSGVTPAIGDRITAEGRAWLVVTLDRDPAAASYEARVRPA